MPELDAEGDETGELELVLPPESAGTRLDLALSELLPRRSRSFLSKLLKEGAILLDGKAAKPSYKVRGGERVAIEWPEPEIIEARPESIPLQVLHEDADLIVINKPAGMVSHPSTGHTSGSLVNALLAHCKDLSTISGALRPGIVHRLDRDTSGAIVAAKNDTAHRALQEQFAARLVRKEYLALCHGLPKDRFACDGRIGRHPVRRQEMTVMRGADEGREAHTDFEVLQRLRWEMEPNGGSGGAASRASQVLTREACCLVLARPTTGRTHQIRVHLAKAGFPVLADPLYGKEGAAPSLGLSRHALHARSLEFEHPRSAQRMVFKAPLAPDMQEALHRLGGEAVV